jgi:CBS domain-containing protein
MTDAPLARDVLHLSGMRVRDVMRKEVRTIAPTEPASMAKELFRRYDIHHLVVVDKKNVIGLIADRDLMDIGGDTPVQRAMARRPVTISPDETVRKAAALMSGHVIGSLPVVQDGKLVGIVTTFDLVALLAKGATHPAPAGERPVLSKRGPRKKPVMARNRR